MATLCISITVALSILSFEYQESYSEVSALFSWSTTDSTLALYDGNELVWQYNYKTYKGKPHFHPINIAGTTITENVPPDHPWHLGLWHSWKYINGINYWEYDQTEGVEPWDFTGITEVKNVHIQKRDDFSCIIELDIVYHGKRGPDILSEKRIIEVSSPAYDGSFFIDYDLTIKALAEKVVLDRTPIQGEPNGEEWGGYAGLSIRFNQGLSKPHHINSDESVDLKHGAPMLWKYFGLVNNGGREIGAAIFDHPTSIAHPGAMYVTTHLGGDSLFYLGTAPLFHESTSLSFADELHFKHRVAFYENGASFERLQRSWNDFKK